MTEIVTTSEGFTKKKELEKLHIEFESLVDALKQRSNDAYLTDDHEREIVEVADRVARIVEGDKALCFTAVKYV